MIKQRNIFNKVLMNFVCFLVIFEAHLIELHEQIFHLETFSAS